MIAYEQSRTEIITMKKDRLKRLENDLVSIEDILDFLLDAYHSPKESENNLKMSLENIQDKVWYWRAMVWSELKEQQIN
jgi:hypothetical protein